MFGGINVENKTFVNSGLYTEKMSDKEKINTEGFKLSFLSNLITLLLFTALGVGLYIFIMKEFESQKLKEFKTEAGIISGEIIRDNILTNDSTDLTSVGQMFAYVNKYNIKYCIVSDDSGRIRKSFNPAEAVSNSYLSSEADGNYNLSSSLYQIKCSFNHKDENYLIYLGIRGRIIEDYLIEKNNLIIPVISGLMFLGFLILVLANKILISSPVNKIAYAAQQISNGNLDIRSRYHKNNELGVITSTMNFLAHHLDKSNNQITSLNKELKSIVKDKIGELNLEVNQRRLAEYRLRQSEEQFRLLFERAPIGMVILSLEGKIIKSNNAFCETLGYSADEIEKKNISEITVKEYIGYDRQLHTALLNGKLSHVYFEKELQKKDGLNIHAIVESVLTRDANNNPLHIIQQMIDITERKKVEKELIISKERAEESDRLKSAFLAQMSHEIRTPLNVILTATPMLAEDLSTGDEDINILLESVSSAGKRLQRTIDMILNLSSVQSGNYMTQFEVVNLGEDLKRLVDEMKSLAMEKNLELTFTNNVYDPVIKADKYTVNQIFQNLLGNAIKYTQAGKIEVQITNHTPGKINVEVKDTGIGMSKEYMAKLFTPFSQEDMGYKREFEGNGLGLALVKKYVELNRAEIFVSSQKKKGTIFKVVFNKLADKSAKAVEENKLQMISH